MLVPGPEANLVRTVGGLLAFYATGRTDEGSSDVKLRGYILAVEDLPAWAVGEAARRWFRGDCGAQRYDFAPAPATLRSIAQGIAQVAAGQLVVMRRILAAQPSEEISAEERARVARLQDGLAREIRAAAERANPYRRRNNAGAGMSPAEQAKAALRAASNLSDEDFERAWADTPDAGDPRASEAA